MTAAVDNKTLHFFLFIFSVPFYFVCFRFFFLYSQSYIAAHPTGCLLAPGETKLPQVCLTPSPPPHRLVQIDMSPQVLRRTLKGALQHPIDRGFPTLPPLPPNFIASHSFLFLSLNNYPMPRPEQDELEGASEDRSSSCSEIRPTQ